MKIRKDLFGIEPSIGDTIVFNPAKFKGLVTGTCKGFAQSGLPEVEVESSKRLGQRNVNCYLTPKTGFVIRKAEQKIFVVVVPESGPVSARTTRENAVRSKNSFQHDLGCSGSNQIAYIREIILK